MLELDLCDYSDAYVIIKGKITVDGAANIDRQLINLDLKVMTQNVLVSQYH